MRDALEHLVSLHPAYRFGRLAHRQCGLAAGEEQESRDLRGRPEHEIERGEPTGMIEAAAAAAVLAVFFAVLTVVASVTIDLPDSARRELATTSDLAVAH
jgi:hypothetical protein